ncbi:MAG: hypothetical protein KIT69_02770 [Propionibacteriaceae bacterium]|nr:hypothetical protein [Propionibacteriaceae bacterium]
MIKHFLLKNISQKLLTNNFSRSYCINSHFVSIDKLNERISYLESELKQLNVQKLNDLQKLNDIQNIKKNQKITELICNNLTNQVNNLTNQVNKNNNDTGSLPNSNPKITSKLILGNEEQEFINILNSEIDTHIEKIKNTVGGELSNRIEKFRNNIIITSMLLSIPISYSLTLLTIMYSNF